jgi:hypothetical protein
MQHSRKATTFFPFTGCMVLLFRLYAVWLCKVPCQGADHLACYMSHPPGRACSWL